MKIAIVGAFHGTHVGGSLARAAERAGLETLLFDTANAKGPAMLSSIIHRFAGHRPAYLDRFSSAVAERCMSDGAAVLIATGAASLNASALSALKVHGVRSINFSTDDPFGSQGSGWHREALPHYDVVCTPRTANIGDLQALGCAVEYLPFGYDEKYCFPIASAPEVEGHDALFVGGGDRDRLEFVEAYLRAGGTIALAGAYWSRFTRTKSLSLGIKNPEEVRRLTASAKVNICLVRRTNRDGHVMRSFEMAAIGGCMLVEDTEEHRVIFGPNDVCVRYFRGPEEAAREVFRLIGDEASRRRLKLAVREHIVVGKHTYFDRLQTMLSYVNHSISQAD